MSDTIQWANVWKIKLYFEKEIEMLLQKKWGKNVFFFFKKPLISTFEENSVSQLFVFIVLFSIFLSNESYVHYAVCYNRKVALNSILNYKKTLLVVLCSKLLQNLASKDAGILFLIRFLCCHYPKIWKMTFRQPSNAI